MKLKILKKSSFHYRVESVNSPSDHKKPAKKKKLRGKLFYLDQIAAFHKNEAFFRGLSTTTSIPKKNRIKLMKI